MVENTAHDIAKMVAYTVDLNCEYDEKMDGLLTSLRAVGKAVGNTFTIQDENGKQFIVTVKPVK